MIKAFHCEIYPQAIAILNSFFRINACQKKTSSHSVNYECILKDKTKHKPDQVYQSNLLIT